MLQKDINKGIRNFEQKINYDDHTLNSQPKLGKISNNELINGHCQSSVVELVDKTGLVSPCSLQGCN
jgi:hypothetical protein